MHFGHVLQKCLGVGFVEDNLVSDAPYTNSPTRTPSALPSMYPSVVVSGVPSSVPSLSGEPSSAPVGTPTLAPVTDEPTATPSADPTMTPSFSPSHSPSLSPTTKKPTKRPTHMVGIMTPAPVATTTTTTSTHAAAAFVIAQSQVVRPIVDTTSSEVSPESDLVPKLSQYNSNNGGHAWHQTDVPTHSPTHDAGRKESNTEIPTTFMPSSQPSEGPKSIGLSIPFDKDATVSEGESITPFGNYETIMVDGTIGNRYDTMLAVDLGFLMAIPEYKSITLRLFVVEYSGEYCGTFQTTLVPWWDENSVTWMNAPGANGDVIGDAIVTEESKWVELDVTELLTNMNAESLLSIRLVSNEGNRCVFASKNGSNTLRAPNLLVLL